MSVDRPEPEAELIDRGASSPRPAATVIVLRGGAERLEVLLVKRNPDAPFMGGVWVFPGGSVSEGDRGEPSGGGNGNDGEDRNDGHRDGQPALRAAARRELHEEAGIALDPDAELVAFSRWITPAHVRRRFDTWFYLAVAPERGEPVVDGGEIVDFRWITPGDALEAAAAGELLLVIPTVKQLQQLALFPSALGLLEHARSRRVRPIARRVTGSGETARIALPGEPG